MVSAELSWEGLVMVHMTGMAIQTCREDCSGDAVPYTGRLLRWRGPSAPVPHAFHTWWEWCDCAQVTSLHVINCAGPFKCTRISRCPHTPICSYLLFPP